MQCSASREKTVILGLIRTLLQTPVKSLKTLEEKQHLISEMEIITRRLHRLMNHIYSHTKMHGRCEISLNVIKELENLSLVIREKLEEFAKAKSISRDIGRIHRKYYTPSRM